MKEGSGSIPLTSGSGSRRPKIYGSRSATLAVTKSIKITAISNMSTYLG
jgi:hypothetical protein